MEGSEGRKRSQSVPILSQIDKILDRGNEFGVFERRKGEEYSRFPETRSPRNITRSKARLSSGGLIRNQKRRHSRAVMESTQTEDQGRPRALYTSSVIDVDTVGHSLDSIPTGITTEYDHTSSHSLRADIAEPQPSGFYERHVSRKRSKALYLETRKDFSQRETIDHSSRAKEVGDGALNQEQTANAGFCREKKLFHRRLSLPTCLQYEIEDSERDSPRTDMTKSSSLDCSNLDKPASLIADFDKMSMIKLKRSEPEMEEHLSDFRRRRRSLPCCLEQSNLLMEPSLENGNSDEDFRLDSTLQKTMKIKAQRSQSLPLTSSSVGEVRVPLKEEYSNWRNGEYGFRQPLRHIEKTSNEYSPQTKTSHKTRSKSLPLVLDKEGKANMSVNLIKHVTKQRGLQSHDRLHDMKPKTRRVKSLPFIIYEDFTERELLSNAQIMHIHSYAKSSDSDRKESTISNERKQLHDNGNIKHKAQLERARSLPLCLAGGHHRQISHIQEDLNKAIDSFFSNIEDKDRNVGFRGRSKSLPNILEGENVMPAVAKTLEDERDIPEIVIAEGYFSDAVGNVGCESQIDRERKQSPSREEKITNEESNSDASSDCDELESQISNTTYANDIPALATRPRGFSIPSSFKMEKIPEEPNENENCETLSSCEHGGTENRTNLICKDRLKGTMDSASPVAILNVSEEGKDTLAGQAVDDEASSARGTTAAKQQADNHSLEIFNKIVTKSSSRIRQLEFAKSSSCLHRAAANGDLEHVKLLVEGGDDVNALDESGWPVLHAAVTTGNFACGAWLVDADADLVGYTNFVIDEYRLLCQQVYLNY